MKKYFILCLVALFPFSAFASDDWTWLRSYKGKSTNQLMLDKKFKNFLNNQIPIFSADFGMARNNKKTSLVEVTELTLGGPPDLITLPTETTLTAAACREHSCEEKAFFWANLGEKKSVIAIVHHIFQGKFAEGPQLFLASRSYECKDLPKEALKQLSLWLKSKNISPKMSRCLHLQSLTEPYVRSL